MTALKITPLFLFLIILLSISVPICSSVQAITPKVSSSNLISSGDIHDAPLNPEFITYQKIQDNRSPRNEEDERATGEIPSPIHRPDIKDISMFGDNQTYESVFDLRDLEKVSPVRNQGSFGACWAFATFGSLESTLLPDERHSHRKTW